MFDLESEEIVEHIPDLSFEKIPLNTCNTIKRNTSYFSPNSHQQESLLAPVDISFDLQIYQNNAEFVKKSIVCYLKHCLKDKFEESDPFANGNIFHFSSYKKFQNEEDSDLHILVLNNPLLDKKSSQFMFKNFKEFTELRGLFAEIKKILGDAITQEIVFILSPILESKIQQFKQYLLREQEEWIIPKFDRLWGNTDTEEFHIKNKFQDFRDVDENAIKRLILKDSQKIGAHLYFSNKLSYLTLKETSKEIKQQINVVDKFTTLINHLACSIFLTIAGFTQNEAEVKDLTSQMCINTNSEDKIIESTTCKKVKLSEY